MAEQRKRSRDDWASWVRGRLEMGDVGPFTWARMAPSGTGDVRHVVAIARDPGVDLTSGYVGRFLWSVTWPAAGRARSGTAPSLITAEQAVAGAVELGEPPV